jgi:hypothetical protein
MPRQVGSERRATQRYGLELPINLRRAKIDEVLLGETSNISTGGIYFTTNRLLAVNEVLEFSVNFPRLAEDTDVLVVGRARILRVEENPGTMSKAVGIAMLTETYRIVAL